MGHLREGFPFMLKDRFPSCLWMSESGKSGSSYIARTKDGGTSCGNNLALCKLLVQCSILSISNCIRTSSLPWKISGSLVGPMENANVQTASARLSSYGAKSLFNPSFPSASRKYLLVVRGKISLMSVHGCQMPFAIHVGSRKPVHRMKF